MYLVGRCIVNILYYAKKGQTAKYAMCSGQNISFLTSTV